jgi:hypothetical protein
MLTGKDFFDMLGTKFTVGAIYPPEKQKFLEDKLAEEIKAQGLTSSGAVGQAGYIFTLDEAIDYFLRLREIQNAIEEEERSQSTPTETD